MYSLLCEQLFHFGRAFSPEAYLTDFSQIHLALRKEHFHSANVCIEKLEVEFYVDMKSVSKCICVTVGQEISKP